jgi:hypothetical protein
MRRLSTQPGDASSLESLRHTPRSLSSLSVTLRGVSRISPVDHVQRRGVSLQAITAVGQLTDGQLTAVGQLSISLPVVLASSGSVSPHQSESRFRDRTRNRKLPRSS